MSKEKDVQAQVAAEAPRYSKQQFKESPVYADRLDVIEVVLEDGTLYTMDEAADKVADFLRKEVTE